MTPKDVVTALWDRIQARDWAGVGALVAVDAVVEWPVTGERIVGRDRFLRVQMEYPEGWSIRVLRVVAEGEWVASEVEVPHVDAGLFRDAAFWTVRDGVIVAGTEYWTTPGSEEVPPWRRDITELM